MPNHDVPPADQRLVASAMASFIKIGALLILIMWCFDILSPFIGIVSWAVIIAVALYPLHVSLSGRLGGREKISAIVLALICIVIILVPTWIVAESTVSGLKQISENIKDGTASIPAPAESVAQWPVIGGKVHELWSAAAVNLSATLNNFGPQLRSLGQKSMGLAAAGAFTVLQFIASFIIAGVLLTTAASSHRFTNAFFGRLLGAEHGATITELSIQTIRSVAKGILGIAFVQAVLAAIGLVVMDVPAAGLWAGAVLVVAIAQLPPILVLGPIAAWVFSVADPVPAVIFLVYAILVSFSDALLKPLLLGRGVRVPMLVILLGAIGGAISAGLIGLFVGAVVLALGYQIMTAWLEMDDAAQAAPGDAERGS
jgi:predicted PurR-regulated permease PerM